MAGGLGFPVTTLQTTHQRNLGMTNLQQNRSMDAKYLPPPMSIPPPRNDGPPPPPRGGTVNHSRPANFSITQLKIFFGAFGACDFLLISYCSWAK